MRRTRTKHDPVTQTDAYWCPSGQCFLGICFGLFGVVLAVSHVYSLVVAKGPSVAGSAFSGAVIAVSLFLGVGIVRRRVIVAPGELTVRGSYTTKKAVAREITAINYGFGLRGEASVPYWIPYAELVDGSVIWMAALDGGEIHKHPTPLTLEEVRSIRRTLRVGGSDRTDRVARAPWSRGFDTLSRRARSLLDH